MTALEDFTSLLCPRWFSPSMAVVVEPQMEDDDEFYLQTAEMMSPERRFL
jgi:hypothetical protein